jgi:hypothetical protein
MSIVGHVPDRRRHRRCAAITLITGHQASLFPSVTRTEVRVESAQPWKSGRNVADHFPLAPGVGHANAPVPTVVTRRN